MNADDEFNGKPFYPSKFYWKTQHKEIDKVKQTCRILNALTQEQIQAVEHYAQSEAESAYDFGEHQGETN